MATAIKKTAKLQSLPAKSKKPVPAKPATGKKAAPAVSVARAPIKAVPKSAQKVAPKAVQKAAPKASAKAVNKIASVKPVQASAQKAAKPVAAKVPPSNEKSTIKPNTTPTTKSAKARQIAPDSASGAAPTVLQTTDAATLAAIDTSGYILPSVKVPGRRGRKPKEFQPENDEVAALNAVERAEIKAADKARAKDRKAKERALLKDVFSADTEATEEELERRREKLKTLIKLGKERNFLTYAEINDHLPENIVEPEAIEGIIGTFNDMGIAVYEHAPDAESLLLTDDVPTVTSDEEVEAAAEAALSTVDSDFGRTTDPVRMYIARNGLCRAAHARRRDRNCQAHRGRSY